MMSLILFCSSAAVHLLVLQPRSRPCVFGRCEGSAA